MEARYNKLRHEYGLLKEKELKALLEAVCREPLTKISHRYSIIDFESPSFYVELKSRTPKYRPETLKSWLLPTCKAKEAKKRNDKQSLFFYYWSATDQLFVLEYNEELFATFPKEIPDWHQDQQEHYYIPSEHWTLITVE
jgi:hypothetical protein